MIPRWMTGWLLGLLLAGGSVFAQDEVAFPPVDGELAACLQEAKLVWEPDADGDCRLLLEYESGRSQQVFVTSRTEELDGWKLREIWSVAGMGATLQEPVNMELLLRTNPDQLLGAWGYRQIGEQTAAVFVLKAPAACDPQQLRRLIALVGRSADEMEQSLGEGDQF